ncbi:MAG: hypothetical protein HYY04_18535 [Chloroflexi bacterium]|nr:hypothetical protein [Chloroflexota bacterium]
MAPPARQRISGFVILTLAYRKEGDLWAGRCRELGTATDGERLEEVHDELIELVELHLSALEEVGERERFFREHGMTFYTDGEPTQVTRTVPVNSEELFEVHRVPVGVVV